MTMTAATNDDVTAARAFACVPADITGSTLQLCAAAHCRLHQAPLQPCKRSRRRNFKAFSAAAIATAFRPPMLAAAAFALIFAACAQASQQPADDWNLVRIADGTALCLDGSPAAFYIRAGSQANANKWIMHLEGGGWATDLGGHFARSQVRVCSITLAATGSLTLLADRAWQQLELLLHRQLRPHGPAQL